MTVIRPKSKADDLIRKFKLREQQAGIQQALVFLKLKQFDCPTRQALLFSRKKERNIDVTQSKDGPTNFRKLIPYKPDGIIVNGWLKGQKLKYKDATSFNHFLRHSSASLSQKINNFNKKTRAVEEQERIQRGQSLFWIDPKKNMKENINKIVALRQNLMKERQSNPFVFKVKGLTLSQMTKIFSQQMSKCDGKGLVIKTGAFQHCMNDPKIQYVSTEQNSYSKASSNLRQAVQNKILSKRNQILNYKMFFEQKQQSQPLLKEMDKMTKKNNRSFSKKGNDSKIVRSKSALGRHEIRQFQDKLTIAIRNQLSTTSSSKFQNLTDIKKNTYKLKQGSKKLRLET